MKKKPMEILRVMVKSILVIIILAAFLEFILPRSEMKRYVNLIIGLFVLIALLNPFLTVIRQGASLNIFDRPAGGANNGAALDTRTLMQKGRQIAAGQKAAAARQYKEKLTRQIAALAGLEQSAGITGVEVELVEDPEAPNFGQLKRIILRADNGNKDNKQRKERSESVVGEVRIEQIGLPSNESDRAGPGEAKTGGKLTALREMIASFYGLGPGQVEVQ